MEAQSMMENTVSELTESARSEEDGRVSRDSDSAVTKTVMIYQPQPRSPSHSTSSSSSVMPELNDLDEEPERGSHFCFSAEIDEALFEGNGSFGKSITDHPYFKAPKVLAETPHLLSYPPSKKKWRVSLINLERWRLDVLNEYPTLDFIFVDENEKTQKLYNQMHSWLEKYYSPLHSCVMGRLEEEDLKNGMLVVANVGGGVYQRAVLQDISTDKGMFGEALKIIRPQFMVCLMDDNTSIPYDKRKIHLYYMVEAFLRLPYRVNQFFLTGTEDCHNFIEFRNTLCSMLNEQDVFEVVVDVADDDLAFVTLWSSKYEVSVNDAVQQKTIERFEKPALPPVGEFYGHANLSHVDGNGDVYIQFRVYSFEYFESVQESILPADFERAKMEGPYEMDYETIYLALYDALYYRCKVLKINGDKVTIMFIDYGNTSIENKLDLVPCSVVSSVFEKFHAQAIPAHFANIASIHIDTLYYKLPLERLVSIETVLEATADSRAEIEVVLFDLKDKPVRIGELGIKEGWISCWEKPTLEYRTSLSFKSIGPEAVNMKGTNWSTPDSPVYAQPGSVLNARSFEVQDPDSIFITPIQAENQLHHLEVTMAKSVVLKYMRKSNSSASGWICLEDNLYYALYVPGRSVNETPRPYVRIRLADDPSKCVDPNEKIRVLRIDYGLIEEVSQNAIFYLETRFCELPPFSAKLKLPNNKIPDWGLNHRHIMEGFLIHRHLLIKVNRVDYDAKSERCEILGDLYYSEKVLIENGLQVLPPNEVPKAISRWPKFNFKEYAKTAFAHLAPTKSLNSPYRPRIRNN